MKVFLYWINTLLFLGYCNICFAQSGGYITTANLLDEMIFFDAATKYPVPYYTCKQMSSYDRRAIAPGKPHWFANDDGAGFIRLDTIEGRIEKVMLDEKGPGAITRIWMTTSIKNGTLRFYFDNNTKPTFIIDGYDMSKAPFYTGQALSLKHTHYKEDKDATGGNTYMFPMPYQKSCRITFEEPDYSKKIPRYYQINFRTYPAQTKVQTFSVGIANALQQKIKAVNETLLHPPTFTEGLTKKESLNILKNKFIRLSLPTGSYAIRTLHISAKARQADSNLMRKLVLKISFDSKETVWVPLSDFAGGGFGSPKVESWFLNCDGNGDVISRWVMPYKKNAVIEIKNLNDYPVDVTLQTNSTPWKWSASDLYFHTSWKQQQSIPLTNEYDKDELNSEWNFTTLNGKGVYRGDLLTLYNYAPDWYGEGDEKIYVDKEAFPSHFGTGTEDYYNCSWAPVVVFQTPYGGATRADDESSHGYNSFLRTRNLDNIPFNSNLRFNIELQSWHAGKVDYATTVFWYGTLKSKAEFIPNEKDISAPK